VLGPDHPILLDRRAVVVRSVYDGRSESAPVGASIEHVETDHTGSLRPECLVEDTFECRASAGLGTI
jgi:hypothetical protein